MRMLVREGVNTVIKVNKVAELAKEVASKVIKEGLNIHRKRKVASDKLRMASSQME